MLLARPPSQQDPESLPARIKACGARQVGVAPIAPRRYGEEATEKDKENPLVRTPDTTAGRLALDEEA
ncbi:hypothetical protein Q4I32_008215 [Leishmania shawi]|uniref:Uncharacterized protein n=1 Tax=Leishmania shawi TaxID=5680 RepID=A0AAW3B522_9TRYP